MTDLDIDRPSTYRLYDYLLGGSFNFAADRAFAREVIDLVPWAHDVARMNRGFLTRAVRHCVRRDVRQFLDLGSGIQTVSRVDQIARAADPRCRVAYVDTNPMVIAHSEVVLCGDEQAVAARVDMRDASAVLRHPAVAGLLDLDQPVAVLMCAAVHFLADADDPAGAIAEYRDALPVGSMLVLSHATYDDVPGEVAKVAPMFRAGQETVTDRSREEIVSFFDGWELAEPGVVFTGEWRPDLSGYDDDDQPGADPGRAVFLAGVASKTKP